MNKDRSLTDLPFENFRGSLLIFGPVPFVVLSKQSMERFHHVGKPWNPVPIKIDKTNELVDTLHSHGSLPLYNVHNLLIAHFKPFVTNIDSEELYLFLMKFTFLCVTEKPHILQTLKGIMDALNVFSFSLMMIEHIVQVVLQVFIEEQCKHFIHVSLEARQHVHKPKVITCIWYSPKGVINVIFHSSSGQI
jgi:hypothetical protein